MPRLSRLLSRDSREARAVLAGTASAAAAEVEAALAVPPDPTAAAFFDVDNTMMVGASIFHFARGLDARKFFTTADLAGFAWQQLKFRIGGRDPSETTAPLVWRDEYPRPEARTWLEKKSPPSR